MYECDDKMVSHPSHYQGKNGLELIDVIEAFTADLSGIEATDTGNILKYACRWKQKNGVQDLKKIMWYTQHLIDHLESTETKEEPESSADVTDKVMPDDIDMVFATWEDANHFTKCMRNKLTVYGAITMVDVYAYLGKVCPYTFALHGWTTLKGWTASSIRSGEVTIKLTPATKLK